MKQLILSCLVAGLPLTAPAAEEKAKPATEGKAKPAAEEKSKPVVEEKSKPTDAAPSASDATPAGQANAEELLEGIEEKLNADSDLTPDDKEFAPMWQKRLAEVDSMIAEFRKRFPKDPLRWKVLMLEANARDVREELKLPIPKDSRPATEIYAEIVNSPDADAETKAEASAARLIAIGENLGDKKGALEAWEADYAKHVKAFPDYEDNLALLEMRLTLVEEHAPAKLMPLLEELSKSSNSEIADMAKEKLSMAKLKAELKSKPLDLKFTAMDGKEVDLQKLRGKVVLIDFWATWCGPCMAEMPKVLNAYKALHEKGFEIIGISLDEDEADLKKVIKDKEIPWSQFFDGKGWENVYAKKYGIDGIPAMWLVNKAGMVVETDATENLEEKVEKLLKE